MELDLSFTKEVSVWLNKFTNDLAKKPDKIKEAIEDFEGNKIIIKTAIERGPDMFNNDPEACKELINFIEFYATGKVSKDITVKLKEKENARE